jgi:hypothetical protein
MYRVYRRNSSYAGSVAFRAITVAIAVTALSACSDDAQEEPDAMAGGPDAAAGIDGGEAETITLPPTSGTLDLPFTIALSGSGTGTVGQISIVDGAGVVSVHGRSIDAVVYERQPWPEFGYTLYQMLAVDDDAWYVLWAYCDGQTLEHFYYEGTDGTALDTEPATGTCAGTDQASTVSVNLPAVDMPTPETDLGFTFLGAELELDGVNAGRVHIAGRDMVLLPFESVDCTSVCGAGSWHELHALLWDREAGRACFGIFYMTVGMDDRVALTYSLTLPDLSDPAGYTVFDAMWDVPL